MRRFDVAAGDDGLNEVAPQYRFGGDRRAQPPAHGQHAQHADDHQLAEGSPAMLAKEGRLVGLRSKVVGRCGSLARLSDGFAERRIPVHDARSSARTFVVLLAVVLVPPQHLGGLGGRRLRVMERARMNRPGWRGRAFGRWGGLCQGEAPVSMHRGPRGSGHRDNSP